MPTKPNSKAVLLSALLAAALPAAGFPQGLVRRGQPARQGAAWTERLQCNSRFADGGRLIVRADGGSIRVRTGPPGRVSCTVTLRDFTPNAASAAQYFNAYRLMLRPIAGGIRLSGAGAGRSKSAGAEYAVTIPSRSSVDLQTEIGNITISDPIAGAIQAITAGGDIRMGNASGPVEVKTAGGNIMMGDIGASVTAKTAGGRVRVGDVKGDATIETSGGDIQAGRVAGVARLETAGGDIALLSAGGPVQAETSGGQIHIGRTNGSVSAQTMGGSVHIEGARGLVRVETAGGGIDLTEVRGPVRAETRGGNIVAQIAATGNAFGPSSLETTTGDVKVYLPPTLPVTIDAVIAAARGHKIISDFPLQIEGGNQPFVPTTIRGRGMLNGGGKLLKIRCTGGDIEILKLDSQILRRLRAQQAAFWKRWSEQFQP